MSSSKLNDTADFVSASATTKDRPAARSTSAHVRAELAGLSHPGRVRPNNEDHYLAVCFGRFLRTLATNVPPDLVPDQVEETGYGMLVADGVGGAAAGEVASRLAIGTLVQLVLNTPDWMLRSGDMETQVIMERMTQRYRDVDATLTEQAAHEPTLAGMSTTMTLACSLGSLMVVGHLGDSRAYLHRADNLTRLTRDHTVAQGLADTGLLAPEQVATHRLRHMLTRTLGFSAGRVEPEILQIALAPGDQVLLCTDGLTEMVPEPGIEMILRRPGSVDELCQALVDAALKAGGRDNVTVVLARYQFTETHEG
jgi:protein phosphatase